jgi:outer membrane protein OmpA-like peptidoglycan-associated protein
VSGYELTLRGKLTLVLLAAIMLTAIYSAYALLGQAGNSSATMPTPPAGNLQPPVSLPDDVTPTSPSFPPADPTPGTPPSPVSPAEPQPDSSGPDKPAVPNAPDSPSSAPPVSAQIPQTKLTVYFMPGDTALSDMARDDLQNFVRLVPGFQNVSVLIEGSALPGEYDGEPEELAGRRARAIAEYLKELGVPADHTIPTTFFAPNSEFSGAILSYTGRNGK